MHRIVHDGRPKFGHLKHSIYSLLKDKKPGLIVDVGAAAGMMTRRALHYSPASRAICFEPFPGNWPHIEKTLGALDNVTIVKQAVSDQPGEADFYVSSTVSAEQNWHGLVGYSSVGRIVTKIVDPEKTIRAPVTTIDAHVGEPVLFLKIDVQRNELGVLRGAVKTFEKGIEAALIEFTGDIDILHFLFDRGHTVYNDLFVILPRIEAPDLSAWDIESTAISSTGRTVLRGWPKQHVSDPEQFCARLKSIRGCSIWTDLIAVAP